MKWPPPLPGRVQWAWLLGTKLRRRRVRRMVGLLLPHLPKNPVVLDVGAGPGFFTEELLLSAQVRRQILLDPQAGMLTRAARPGTAPHPDSPPKELMQADATRLPFADEAVDVLVSVGLLCCLVDDAVGPAVRESWRVLRPGGLFLVGVPRWRGSEDEATILGERFVRRETLRPGRSLFQKPI